MDPATSIVIIGAGPAGLAAADALVKRGFRPIVLEAGDQVGGIARTVSFHGNRMDVGGHRFFSESPEVMAWWLSILPLQGAPARDDRRLSREIPLDPSPGAPDPELTDEVMLVRKRSSHIHYLGELFDYPITLSPATLAKLGFWRTLRIGASYAAARIRPVAPERSLEDFMVNRFGRVLYEMFFRGYTEKVWGVPCADISAEWGRQRIRGISVSEVLHHALRTVIGTAGERTEKSLIGWFYYPKFGPGQLYERVAERVCAGGGEIRFGTRVESMTIQDGRVSALTVRCLETGAVERITPDVVFSSMPLADLVSNAEGESPDAAVLDVVRGLPFRDFITVGVLAEQLRPEAATGAGRDTWLYVQEPEIQLGRIQFFNNWSPYILANDSLVWLGLEYFCKKGDDLWSRSDSELRELATDELARIGLVGRENVRDAVVLRVEQAYPAYFDTHDRIDLVRDWVDSIENLYVMGRNGMHRYNNMDDSILSAWAAVSASLGEASRADVWAAGSGVGADA